MRVHTSGFAVMSGAGGDSGHAGRPALGGKTLKIGARVGVRFDVALTPSPPPLQAWRGSQSPRPRSALKHVSSSVSHDSEASAVTERTPSGRRMPRKVSFQVSTLYPVPPPRPARPQVNCACGSDELSCSLCGRTQVHGLAPPQEVAAEGSDGGAAEQAHKRIKNSEEFSMKFLVDKFYGKVRGG